MTVTSSQSGGITALLSLSCCQFCPPDLLFPDQRQTCVCKDLHPGEIGFISWAQDKPWAEGTAAFSTPTQPALTWRMNVTSLTSDPFLPAAAWNRSTPPHGEGT